MASNFEIKNRKNKQHRHEIEQFCRDFLKGGNTQLHIVIDNYRHLLAQIDIQQMDITTQEMLDRSFKNICKILFNTRPADKSCIIALLGFTLKLNAYQLSCSWYHVDMLINSLVDVLEDINFQPKELVDTPSNCMIL